MGSNITQLRELVRMIAERQNTQQRVLQVSAYLFNSFGIEAGSNAQIAAALGISPGNLTYHFKKKSDLITAHMAVFERRLKAVITRLPRHSSAKQFTAAYLDLLELTLGYRFLFLGANYILRNDLVPVERYQRLVAVLKRTYIGHFNKLIAEGHMQPIKRPYSVRILVDSIWWRWLGWLNSMQIASRGKVNPDRKLLSDAVLQVFSLNQHYVDPKFFRAVQLELQDVKRQEPDPQQDLLRLLQGLRDGD